MGEPATAAVRLLSGEREPVRVATTGNILLQGLQTVDGVALAVNDRVLVKDQSDATLNGIYTASTGRWFRASDANFPRAIGEGVTVQSQEGAVNGGRAWRFAKTISRIGAEPIQISFYLSASFSADAENVVTAQKLSLGLFVASQTSTLTTFVTTQAASFTSFLNNSIDSAKGQVSAVAAQVISPLVAAAQAAKDIAAGYASDAFTKGEVQVVSTVQGLPGLSIGAGVKALRFNGYAAQDDGFGWPLAVEVPIAPLADQPWHRVSNNGTRRWQLQAQEVLLEWFGGKGDAVYSQNAFTSGTDNYPAYVAAEAFLAATNPQRSVDTNLGGRVLLGYGSYYSSQSWNLKHRMEIIGKNGGSGSAATRYNTALIFPKDVTGIYVNRGDTSYDLKTASTTSAGSTYLEGFTVIAIDGGTDRTKHGIRFRALGEAYGVNVLNFAGDGINIVATSGSTDDSRHGNANYSKITNGRMANCHNGVNIEGADANACTLLAVNTGGCRAWGIRDASFLGNTIVGGGSQSGSTLSRCFYNGNRYWAGPAGAYEAPGSTSSVYNTTTPGTNPEVWTLWEAGAGGGNLREWTPGNTLEWTFGGSLCILNSNSKTTVFGGYFGESNEAPFYMNPNSSGASYGGLRSGGGGGFHPLSGGRVDFQGVVTAKAVRGTSLDINAGADPIAEAVFSNNGTLSAGKGARWATYMGLKSDGARRPAGALLGRLTASNSANNTAVALQYYDVTANAWASAIDFNGATKEALPEGDNAWTLGKFANRWIKGWFGNISLFPPASVTPANNGEMTFQLTSNTALAVRVKGSDGVVRTGTITLS